jgi:hypothetical protein
MIRLNIFTNEIRPDGELVDRLAVAVEVRGQELNVTAGDPRFLQVGIPVYSERYGRLIDFDTDGEEWALNLPSAYRNGAVNVSVKEVIEPVASPSAAHRSHNAPALTFEHAHQPG